jgi:hypothetical protein
MTLRQGRANSAAALFIGNSRDTWGALPLPHDLGQYGMTGCMLWSSRGLVLGTGIDAAGNASVCVPIPSDPTRQDGIVYSQFLVVDIGANPLGATVSPGGLSIIR